MYYNSIFGFGFFCTFDLLSMKRSIIILFATFYLVLVSGLNVSLHFCGGKIKSISFTGANDEKGCCGNKEKSKKCCHETSTYFKVSNDQFASHHCTLQVKSTTLFSFVYLQPSNNVLKSNINYTALNNHSPPVLLNKPLYLQHKVLII